MSSHKPKKQIVGYKYFMGIHMILCHGPIDGIKQIWVGEKCAWPTTENIDDEPASFELLTDLFGDRVIDSPVESTVVADDGATEAIVDQDNLFGGTDKEGGVSGTVDFAYGGSSQAVNDYLAEQLNPDTEWDSGQLAARIPAFRGLVGIILRQVYIGTSPYIKPWSFLCKRTDILQDGSAQWYIAKAEIDGDLNPAHIIRECLTNELWGLGYSEAYIDSTSFEYVADTLYAENFGLSFVWNTNTSIEDFINDVLKHIDGMMYQDISTGKFVLKLAREDYTVGDLDVFDESNIVEIKDYGRETYGEILNQIVVKYTDVGEDKTATATAQDIAVMNLQGGSVIEAEVNYKGITKADLANMVAARELRQSTSLLARMTIIGNRSMTSLRPNDVFKLDWPLLDIEEMVVRVVTCNYGSLTQGMIELVVVEDVFQAASAITAEAPVTGWEDPVTDAVDVTAQILMEIPYWTIVKQNGESYAEALDADAGFLGVGALKPSGDSLDYELWVRDGLTLDFEIEGLGDFTPTATLDASLPLNAADATIALNNVQDLDLVVADSFAVIENEIVKVKAINTTDNEITIARGCLDTVPAAHNSATRIWFVETEAFLVGEEYADTEQPGVKFLPGTGSGRLAIADATAHDASAMNKRQVRPYPPGDFKVDGSSYPATFSGQPTLTWKHRNRLTQTVEIVEHSETTITPEEGTTYTLLIYDETLTNLVRTVEGITLETYTYSEEDERSDCSLEGSGDPLNTQLRFVLKSVRSDSSGEAGYDSWQSYDITVARV